MAGLLAVEERVLPVREAVVERADQFGKLRSSLDLHEPERTLTDLHDTALRRPACFLDQRRDLGRLHAPVHHLERGLTRDLATDRIDRPERRLVLLGVDAELGTRLLCDDRERREQALLGMLVETLERHRGHPRRAVHVGRVLALHRPHDQVVGARLHPVADDVRDGCLHERGALRHELGLDPLEHQHRRGVVVERSLCPECLIDLRTLFGDAHAPLLDLFPPLAVGKAAVVEHLAALAQVLVALGDHRLTAFHGCEPLLDLLHRCLVRVQGGGARLGDEGRRVLVCVGEALTCHRCLRRLLDSPPRVDKRHHSEGGQKQRDDDQDGCDDHEWSAVRETVRR
jgi:hypothetical protein